MHADTDAIRALAAANSAHADELAAIASKLAATPTAAELAAAFGPVGQPFAAAFTEAVAHEARTAAALRERASATGDAAYRTARAYDDADERAGARVSGV